MRPHRKTALNWTESLSSGCGNCDVTTKIRLVCSYLSFTISVKSLPGWIVSLLFQLVQTQELQRKRQHRSHQSGTKAARGTRYERKELDCGADEPVVSEIAREQVVIAALRSVIMLCNARLVNSVVVRLPRAALQSAVEGITSTSLCNTTQGWCIRARFHFCLVI